MLRSVFLVLLPAYTTSAAVANVCALPPYISMYEFQDYEPAMAYCAPHYPAQTVTKQLPDRCLTTTSTVILGTSTVTTTSSEACPTVDYLQRRAEEDGESERRKRICKRWETMKKHWEEEDHHTPEQVKKWHERVAWHRKKYPWCHKHHHQELQELPESTYPMPTAKAKRDAGPAPAAKVRRDAMATKSLQWLEYAADLVNCGYDCMQTACSCVAATKVVLKTPAPTCTQTATKSTVVRVTVTDVASSIGCEEHGDLRRS